MKRLTPFIQAALIALALAFTPAAAAKPKVKKMSGPELVQVADVSVGLSGLVCDFCAIALNKTFKKRKEVSGTYVDLDTKTLSVTFYDGTTLDDGTIAKLVERAGYNVTGITRKGEAIMAQPANSETAQ